VGTTADYISAAGISRPEIMNDGTVLDNRHFYHAAFLDSQFSIVTLNLGRRETIGPLSAFQRAQLSCTVIASSDAH
jgi:hypothetical protein